MVVSLPNEYFLCVFSISPNIREGLLDVFYGVYEKDPDKVNFLPECINLYFENICRRWLMNHSDILFISMSFSVHYY